MSQARHRAAPGQGHLRPEPPYQINRRGLSRSFQVTNVFGQYERLENPGCAVLWSTVYRYGLLEKYRQSAGSARSQPRKFEPIST